MNSSPCPGEVNQANAKRASALLLDSFERVQKLLASVVDGLTPEELLWQPEQEANPIGWLLWHLSRVQDDHISELVGSEQVWSTGGWEERFALPYPTSDVGFGQDAATVGQFTVTNPTWLTGYYDEVHERTKQTLQQLRDEDFDRVIDDSYDPPVTIASRLVSVVNDVTQHMGQAAYIRGLVERRRR